MSSNETGVGQGTTGARSGYDDGYSVCPCFWGRAPGSLVRRFIDTQTVSCCRGILRRYRRLRMQRLFAERSRDRHADCGDEREER
jgi:hypothetical protein